MSFFTKKTEALCLSEITAASDYVRQTFNAPINLNRLQDQIEKLVEAKIDDYYHQRFRDWSVADLILLSQTISKQLVSEKKAQKGVK
jgi:hypothetical protein